MMRTLIFASGMLAAMAVSAADSLQSFGYSSEVKLAPGDALYVVRVPEVVYRHSAGAGLADVRVFNAAGESVPYALRRPEPAKAEAATLSPLPIFPLIAQSAAVDQGMDVEVRTDGTVVRLRGNSESNGKSPDARPTAYLIDASKLNTDIKGLDLAFDQSANNVVANVRVEASNDLKSWERWVEDAAILQTEFNGQRLRQLRIDFSPRRAKYWRVSAIGNAFEHAIQTVTPIAASAAVAPEHDRVALKAVATKEQGVFEYESAIALPIDGFHIRVTENNSVVRYDLESRVDEKAAWQVVASGTAYRLNQNGKTLTSPPQSSFEHRALRYRLRMLPPAGAVPELEVQWVPHEIVFAAKGNPPFTLAYGNSTAAGASLAIESLIPGYGTANAMKPTAATLGVETAVKGESALAAPPAYGKYGLWAVLVLGAAVLGYMGTKLAKEAKAP